MLTEHPDTNPIISLLGNSFFKMASIATCCIVTWKRCFEFSHRQIILVCIPMFSKRRNTMIKSNITHNLLVKIKFGWHYKATINTDTRTRYIYFSRSETPCTLTNFHNLKIISRVKNSLLINKELQSQCDRQFSLKIGHDSVSTTMLLLTLPWTCENGFGL